MEIQRKLNNFLELLYRAGASERYLGAYKYALDEKYLGAIGKVVNPPIYYVYMSAPLFDMQQDEMNRLNTAAIESNKRYTCVVPGRNLFEGPQIGFMTSDSANAIGFNGKLLSLVDQHWDEAFPGMQRGSAKGSYYLSNLKNNWLGIWATVMACIDHYIMTIFCNAATSNYTFTDTGSVVESAYMGAVNMPLKLYSQPEQSLDSQTWKKCKAVPYSFSDKGSTLSGCPAEYCPPCAGMSSMAYGLVGGTPQPCEPFSTSPEDLAKDIFDHMKTELAGDQLIRHAESADRPPLNLLPTIYVGARIFHIYVQLGATGSGPLSTFNQNLTENIILHRALSVISLLIELTERGDFKFSCQ